MSETYTFTVDLAAVEHLGLNLYSNTSAALTELIANAWDADATEVHINIPEDKSSITIIDNGHGMSIHDLNEKFLKVAYKRRLSSPTSPNGRPVMGRKGIGKLALFSIAEKVEITSKRENTEAHSLSIDVNELKNHITHSTPYHPTPIENIEFNHSQGTKFVLTELLSSRVGQSISAMKKRIARRFSVISDADNFCVYINNEKINHRDRDDFRNLQFAWKFPQNEIISFPEIVKVFDFSEHQIIHDNTIYSFDGWIGTALKPKDLNTDDMGNLNGISVISRGRIFQENILDKISENRIMKSYITGVIQADFLDSDDKEDIATSDRQRLREDDPRYQALIIFVKKLIDEMYKVWSIERKKYDKEQVLVEYPQLQTWLNDLLPVHRTQAEDLLATVSNLKIDESKEQDRKELYRSTILAFERLKLDNSSAELSKAIESGPEELIKILSSYDSYEISLYHDVVKSRINTINLLESKISENDYENAIRDFIFTHMWLIDPSWERITGTELREQSVHKAFDEEFTDGLTDEERSGRVDLRYQNIGDEHIIVELKRPKRNNFDEYELHKQGKKYRDGLYKILNNISPSTADKARIRVVFLIGNQLDGDKAELNRLFSSINGIVTTYDEMLFKAKAAYTDFIEKTKELDKIRELVEVFD